MTASENPPSSITLGEKKANVKQRFRYVTSRLVLFPFSPQCCQLEGDDNRISPFRWRDRRRNLRPPRKCLRSSCLGLPVAAPSRCAARLGRASRLSELSYRVRCVHLLTAAFDSLHRAHGHRHSPIAPLGAACRPRLGRRCAHPLPGCRRLSSFRNLLHPCALRQQNRILQAARDHLVCDHAAARQLVVAVFLPPFGREAPVSASQHRSSTPRPRREPVSAIRLTHFFR